MIPYDRIISDIRNSKELQEFTESHNVKKLNFEVNQYLFHLCENSDVFQKDNLNDKIIKYCNEYDWFSLELRKDKSVKCKSTKRKENSILNFTESIDNYIIVEIVVKKPEQNFAQ